MVTDNDIREGLRAFTKTLPVSVLAKVKSVDQTKRTCTLDDDGLDMFDVRLQCITQGDTGVLIVPKVGTQAIAIRIEDTDQYMIVQQQETEKMEIAIGQKKVVADQNGIVLNDGTVGMVKCDKMVEWMTKVYSDLQTLTTLLSTSAVAGNGAPLAIVFTPQTPSPDVANFSDDSIKH